MDDFEHWRTDLQSVDLDKRIAAAEYFSQAGTGSAAAAIELVQACGDSESVSQFAVAALEEAGSPPVDSCGVLSELLKSPEAIVAYWAATLLGRLAGTAKDCQNALAKVLSGSSELSVRERAAWALGQIGADSEEAIAALHEAAESKHVRLQRLADAAMKQLQV